MKRRTETIIETHQVQIIRHRKAGAWAWCEECSGYGAAFTLLEVYRLAQECPLQTRNLHVIETPEGVLLICGKSLTTESNQKNPGEQL